MQRVIDSWNALGNVSYAGNTGSQIAGAMAVFVVVLLIQLLVVQVFLQAGKRIASRTKTTADDATLAIVTSIRTPFYVIVALYAGIRLLTLPPSVRQVLGVLFLIAFAVQGIRIAERIIVYLVERIWVRAGQSADDVLGPLRMVLRLVLGTLAVLLVLSNLGVNVTSLIAGLGIGGIAVGFALQKVLSDLFDSFSLYIDRPFRPGDFIVARNVMGTVKRITFNSTRITSLQGEEVIVPNKDMANEWVQNYKRMKTRRVAFTAGVTYETPLASLKEIPGIVEKIMHQIDMVRFDRAHLVHFGEYSLDFEIVYIVETDDYLTHRNIRQEVNLRMLEEFAARGIEMAYPTRTLHMADAGETESAPAATQKSAKAR